MDFLITRRAITTQLCTTIYQYVSVKNFESCENEQLYSYSDDVVRKDGSRKNEDVLEWSWFLKEEEGSRRRIRESLDGKLCGSLVYARARHLRRVLFLTECMTEKVCLHAFIQLNVEADTYDMLS